MHIKTREMQQSDAEPIQKLYQRFVLSYVGPSTRKPAVFRRMARNKDKLNWVALDSQGKVVGYISSVYVKGRRLGIMREIVVDPEQDFEAVARPMVDRIHEIFLEKGAVSINATTIRNPSYQKIFPELGFFSINTDAVFMLTVHDIPRFLEEVTPIFVRRLKRLLDWVGWLKVNCEEHSKFFRKEGEEVEPFAWTNYKMDIEITLKADVLAGLLLGALTSEESLKIERMRVETALPEDQKEKLLVTLFPKKQFLALDFW